MNLASDLVDPGQANVGVSVLFVDDLTQVMTLGRPREAVECAGVHQLDEGGSGFCRQFGLKSAGDTEWKPRATVPAGISARREGR